MLPKTHILFGFIFSALLYFLLGISLLQAFIIFLASFLIDLDHYIYYVYKKKDFNLSNSTKWYNKNKQKWMKMSKTQKSKTYTGLCFLHGIEAIIILAILSFFSTFFLLILSGFLFHQILDTIDLYKKEMCFDKVVSFTYSIWRSKKKKLLQGL